MKEIFIKIGWFLLMVVGMLMVFAIATFISENLVIGLIAMNVYMLGLIYINKT